MKADPFPTTIKITVASQKRKRREQYSKKGLQSKKEKIRKATNEEDNILERN